MGIPVFLEYRHVLGRNRNPNHIPILLVVDWRLSRSHRVVRLEPRQHSLNEHNLNIRLNPAKPHSPFVLVRRFTSPWPVSANTSMALIIRTMRVLSNRRLSLLAQETTECGISQPQFSFHFVHRRRSSSPEIYVRLSDSFSLFICTRLSQKPRLQESLRRTNPHQQVGII